MEGTISNTGVPPLKIDSITLRVDVDTIVQIDTISALGISIPPLCTNLSLLDDRLRRPTGGEREDEEAEGRKGKHRKHPIDGYWSYCSHRSAYSGIASKQGHSLIRSQGSTMPFPLASGEKSRCPWIFALG